MKPVSGAYAAGYNDATHGRAYRENRKNYMSRWTYALGFVAGRRSSNEVLS